MASDELVEIHSPYYERKKDGKKKKKKSKKSTRGGDQFVCDHGRQRMVIVRKSNGISALAALVSGLPLFDPRL